MSTIRIATRSSAQARAQAESIGAQLSAAGYKVELVLVDTLGDRTQAANVPLHSIGGQGVFVKEVQRAVLAGDADIAVHSAKDLPAEVTSGMTIGAFTKRRSAADAMIGQSLDKLPVGATVATGSVRRQAQLGRVRPDLQFIELRGNIETRLAKVPTDGAIVMAVAALEVLGLTDKIAQQLDVNQFVPAVGQGCVAVEHRRDDIECGIALAALDDAQTRHAVLVERAFLAELGSGCSLPIGAHVTDGRLYVFLASDDHRQHFSDNYVVGGELSRDIDMAANAARTAKAALGDP